jgi:hypothetical protein
MVTHIPDRNVFWDEIRNERNPEIEDTGKLYIYYRGGVPDAVVCWEGRQAVEVQRWLRKVSFARCIKPECGIRVNKYGDDCGNH